jgi:hypothetical protein
MSANNSIVVPDWAVAILSAVGIFVCMCFVAYQAEGGRK